MKNREKVGVVVQARLSSQRCNRKMIKDFAGTTLLDILLSKIQNTSIDNDKVYVSVREPELIKVCKKYPFHIFERSAKSANSEGSSVAEIFEWWNILPLESIIMINACCPFLKESTIENFYEDYLRITNNGMFAVFKKRNYVWDTKNELITPISDNLNTKTIEEIKEAAHVLYAGNLQDMGNNIWMGDLTKKDEVFLWDKVEEKECLDIDYEWQFSMCETLYKGGFR